MEARARECWRVAGGSEGGRRCAWMGRGGGVGEHASGAVVELRCSYDPESLTGATATRRVKGTVHWVSAAHAVDADVRLYDRLFVSEDPGEGGRDPVEELNPTSLETIADAKVEPALASAPAGARFQFERQGYFCVDPDSRPGRPVFNRTVTLKDSWAKIQART